MSETLKKDSKTEIVEETEKEMSQEESFCITRDFIDSEILYDNLIRTIKKYHPSADVSLIEKAYDVARTAHKGQLRKSGEPYIIHPLCVATILAELEMDKESIVAGLLHDVVEDTLISDEEIRREFGQEVALLVDGVTKLGKLACEADKVEVQAENLRKMFLAMAKDIRVILIKLADRLHNMRTLQYMKPEQQKEKARETMDIYAPIAQRLGISRIKTELEDLSLKYLEPEAYYDLVEKIAVRKSTRNEYVEMLEDEVGGYLKEAGIEAKIQGRAKHFFSIYKKMVGQGKTLDQIYDLFAIRIIVKDIKDCYAALGVIHEKYKPVPGRFKDYIAMPKANMYQSLHTTLIGPTGQPFEIQIRTQEMHRTSEYGIAAHWKYKEAANGNAIGGKAQEEEKLSWLRQILEWQQEASDNREFMGLLKNDLDLFADTVFCFTPTGDVKNLPMGSTTIDFAYSIHSAVGNRMVGAKVNGKLVPIDYTIRNGDQIEIVTSQNSKGPSMDWLKVVKSTQAKNKINQWFRNEFKEENIQKGKDMLAAYCKSRAIDLADINKPEYQVKVQRKYGFKDWDAVLAAVGRGGLKEAQIINRMLEEHKKHLQRNLTDQQILENLSGEKKGSQAVTKSKSGIIVKGLSDVAVHFSRCCNPVPGDEIVGFITRGRGVSIHRTDCVNMIQLPVMERERLIDAEWEQGSREEADASKVYRVEIKIYGNNRIGLMVDITKVFTGRGIDIRGINTSINKQGMSTISVSFFTRGKDELSSLIDRLRQVESVLDIERTSG